MPRVVLNFSPSGGTDMELLIRINDKHPIVSAMHETGSQRGDVVCACPDGWGWSQAEQDNPDWIIVTATITEVEASALLESGRPGEPQFKRRLGVNPDGLKSGDVLSREQLMARVF